VPRPSIATPLVRDAIRERIVSGRYPPESRLIEQRIASELGVSRVPVRDALRDLLAEGFARERLAGGMEVRRYSDAEIEELISLNEMLETRLALQLADVDNESAVAALRSVIAQAGAALDAGETGHAVELNARFHDVLLDQCAGTITHELLQSIRPRLAWVHRQHGDPAALHAEHTAIADALAARDAESVAELMHAHSLSSQRAVDDLKDRT